MSDELTTPAAEETEGPPATDPEASLLGGILPDLALSAILPLLVERMGLPRTLEAIINDVMRGEEKFDVRRALKRTIQRRISAQEGRSGAELLGRAVVKQLDFHYENELQGVTLEERHAIVSELSQNIARQLLLAAQVIVDYPDKAYAVNHAKETRDVRALAAARTQRTFATEDFKRNLVNVARAAVGDDTQ